MLRLLSKREGGEGLLWQKPQRTSMDSVSTRRAFQALKQMAGEHDESTRHVVSNCGLSGMSWRTGDAPWHEYAGIHRNANTYIYQMLSLTFYPSHSYWFR